jgi:hypothetical protein
MINLKQLLCWHKIIPTSRKLISIHRTMDNDFDMSRINEYLEKGYCIKCKKKFAEVIEINNRFDVKQPYDKKETNV